MQIEVTEEAARAIRRVRELAAIARALEVEERASNERAIEARRSLRHAKRWLSEAMTKGVVRTPLVAGAPREGH